VEEQTNQRSGNSGRQKRAELPGRRYFWLLAGAWTCAVGGSLAWNLAQHADEVRSLTEYAARALLEKDLLYREWSILHGGVYVANPGPTEAGPLAQEEGRQIVTPAGQTLTLLNPVEVSRQVFELQEQQTGIRGHITSLKPVRPANQPDDWERRALEQFGKGRKEVSSVVTLQGERSFRLMRPLVTVPACLRCHEETGHKPGEIRGGISVTVPLSRFVSPGTNLRLGMAHLGLWVVGMAGLIFGARNLQAHSQARQRAEAERERLIAELQEALTKVKTLRGLIPICSSCKKIRDDHGSWTQLETYIAQHSEAEFSHGLCLECMRKLYPDVAGEVEARLAQSKSAPERPAE
jgi:two-component system, chemotaxis family, sensor kinase Cph1